MTYLSPEDRADYEARMEVVCAVSRKRRQSKTLAERTRAMLLKAEVEGKAWAKAMLYEDAMAGHAKRAKGFSKKKAVIVLDYEGTPVATTSLVGHKKRDKDGRTYWQQSFFYELTWDEVEDHVRKWTAAIGADRVALAAGERLLELRDQVPESKGPAEAVELLGLTIEAWLEGDTATGT